MRFATIRANLTVRVRDEVPPPLRPERDELTGVCPGRGETSLACTIEPSTRGRFSFGDIHLRYRSLLGFWERSKTVPAVRDIRIYPAVEEVERYHILARMDQLPSVGNRRVRVHGASWSSKYWQFVNGDDTRLMDWKATARRSRLIVRNQRAERNQTMILLVDCGRLMTAEEQGVSKLDRSVNAALLLAHVGLARRDRSGYAHFPARFTRGWHRARRWDKCAC